MSLISMITDFVGMPQNYAGEVVIYTIAALLLLVVIEEIIGFLRTTYKHFTV